MFKVGLMIYFPSKMRFVSSIRLEDVRNTRHCCHVVNLANSETAVSSSVPAVALEKLCQLSQLAVLEMLSLYFDATRDSESGVGTSSSQTNFLASIHYFKSASDRFMALHEVEHI